MHGDFVVSSYVGKDNYKSIDAGYGMGQMYA